MKVLAALPVVVVALGVNLAMAAPVDEAVTGLVERAPAVRLEHIPFTHGKLLIFDSNPTVFPTTSCIPLKLVSPMMLVAQGTLRATTVSQPSMSSRRLSPGLLNVRQV